MLPRRHSAMRLIALSNSASGWRPRSAHAFAISCRGRTWRTSAGAGCIPTAKAAKVVTSFSENSARQGAAFAPHGPSMRCYDVTSDELLLCIHRGCSFWAFRPPPSRLQQEGTSAEHAGLPISDACPSEPPPKRVAGRHRMDEGESLGWQYYGTFLSVPQRIELINEQNDDYCDFRRQIFPSTDFLNVSVADLLHEVHHEWRLEPGLH